MKTKSMMIIAVVIFFSTNLFAQGPYGVQKHNMQKGHMNIPDLSDAQKEKIKDLRTAHMKEVMPIKNQVNEKKAHLKTISTGDNVNMDKVYSTIEEIGKLRIDMQKKSAKHKQDIRNLLTDDQKVYFDMHKGKANRKNHPGNIRQGKGPNAK